MLQQWRADRFVRPSLVDPRAVPELEARIWRQVRVPAIRIPAPEVTADPERTAADAIESLGGRRFIVHIDVDVLEFLRLPAADVPLYGRGLSLDSLALALRVFASDPRGAALVVVEYNPDHDTTAEAPAVLTDVLLETLSDPQSRP